MEIKLKHLSLNKFNAIIRQGDIFQLPKTRFKVETLLTKQELKSVFSNAARARELDKDGS